MAMGLQVRRPNFYLFIIYIYFYQRLFFCFLNTHMMKLNEETRFLILVETPTRFLFSHTIAPTPPSFSMEEHTLYLMQHHIILCFPNLSSIHPLFSVLSSLFFHIVTLRIDLSLKSSHFFFFDLCL